MIGADPADIDGIWSTIYRAGFYRGGGVLMSALSGIDQALWDIKGKVFGAPVYALMGGKCRDKMKVYSWIGGDRPSDVGQAAKEKMKYSPDCRKSAAKAGLFQQSGVYIKHKGMQQVPKSLDLQGFSGCSFFSKPPSNVYATWTQKTSFIKN